MRLFTSVVIIGVVLAAGALVVWRLDAPPEPAAETAREQPVSFEVPTSRWEPGSPGQLALLSGTLRFTSAGCPYVGSDGHRSWVTMPAGARGVRVDGVRSIVDPEGLVYGIEGETVRWGGGYGGGSNDCGPPAGGSFVVQNPPDLRHLDGTTVVQPDVDLTEPPCQEPADPPGTVHADPIDNGLLARRFDRELRGFTSYAATIRHSDGGLRVRIATGRADTEAARAKAKGIIAQLPQDQHAVVKVADTTVSLNDLRAWTADARNGLTHIPRDDVLRTMTNTLCLYVEVQVRPHTAVRLTEQERMRYALSGFMLRPQR